MRGSGRRISHMARGFTRRLTGRSSQASFGTQRNQGSPGAIANKTLLIDEAFFKTRFALAAVAVFDHRLAWPNSGLISGAEHCRGKAIVDYPNNTGRYQGQWDEKHRRHGIGTMGKSPSQSAVACELWVYFDRLLVLAEYTAPTSKCQQMVLYEGEWHEDAISTHGRVEYADGSVYNGSLFR